MSEALYQKQYRKDNKEKIAEYQKQYRKDNKERIREVRIRREQKERNKNRGDYQPE